MQDPGFWDDADRANKQMKELKQLKDTVDNCNSLKTQYDDIETLIEMGYEANDPEMVPEIRDELDDFISKLESLRISTLLAEEYDKCNAILKLNAGAGGTESCDWAGMLYRMYTRWAEKRGFSIDVLDFLGGSGLAVGIHEIFNLTFAAQDSALTFEIVIAADNAVQSDGFAQGIHHTHFRGAVVVGGPQ